MEALIMQSVVRHWRRRQTPTFVCPGPRVGGQTEEGGREPKEES